MFKREVKSVGELILRNLRQQGLETPLLQRRLIAAWPEVVGERVAAYSSELYIRNQTLYVTISHPALRSDLRLRRSELVRLLNERVGGQVIVDLRF